MELGGGTEDDRHPKHRPYSIASENATLRLVNGVTAASRAPLFVSAPFLTLPPFRLCHSNAHLTSAFRPDIAAAAQFGRPSPPVYHRGERRYDLAGAIRLACSWPFPTPIPMTHPAASPASLRARALRPLLTLALLLPTLLPHPLAAQTGDAPVTPTPVDPLEIVAQQVRAMQEGANEGDLAETAATNISLASVGLPLEAPNMLDGALVGAHSAMAADLDNDGDLDVVSAARGTASAASVGAIEGGSLIWYRNMGGDAPSFEARPIASPSGAYIAWPADLNRDGKIDIIVAAVIDVDPSSVASAASDAASASGSDPASTSGAQEVHGSGAVYWYQNDGQPTPGFTQHTVADGLAYPVSVRTGDLDGDGDLDIVVPTRDDNRVRWFANGGGSVPGFTAMPVADGLMSAVAVDIGDVDRDGDADIVTASEDDDRIVWHANNGSGGFTPYTVRSGQPEPDFDFAKSVFLSDLDGDGDLDIAYASENRNEVGWYRNLGGGPPQWEQHVIAQDRNHVKLVWSADLDMDGDMDLLSASSEDGVFAWYRNDGAAVPSFAAFAISNTAAGARFISTGDLDGDGDLDVLGASRDNNQVVWFRNRLVHRTTDYPSASIRLLGANKDARHLRGADLDGDGDTDLISVNQDLLYWYENGGGFSPTLTPHQIPSSQDRGRWVEPADLDGDGDIDILLAATKNNKIFWYQNNGQRPPSFTERTISNLIVGPRAVMAADLDGDGDLDAFAAGDGDPGSASKIAWYENNGAPLPSFATHEIDDVGGNYARSIFGADMDHDGDIDLLTAEQVGDRLVMYVNNGARPAGFARRVLIEGPEADGAQHVHAADMDGDGDMDAVYAQDTGNRIAWAENVDGGGNVWTPRVVDTDVASVHAVVAADLDGDGDQDIATAVEGSNWGGWYESNGQKPPSFTRHILLRDAAHAHGVSAVDMDSDGDLDLLFAARDSGFYWMENLGGQYRLTDGGFSVISGAGDAASSYAASSWVVQHLGRSVDASIELGNVQMSFVDETGAALGSAELASRATSVAVYADTVANGKLDIPGDRLVAENTALSSASGGRITLNLSQHPPSVGAGPGGSFRFFAVAALNSACGALQLARPVVGPAAGVVVDSLAGSALLAEGQTAVGSAPPIAVADPPMDLRINEIVANPQIGDDWLEIYNAGSFTVSLTGMYLSDDHGDPTKYRIPNHVVIGPHKYLIFIADDEGELMHTNFGLSSSGETVGLYDVDARQNRVLDRVTFAAQDKGVAAGRIPDGGAWRDVLLAPSPGSANERAGLDQRFMIPIAERNLGC